jgi:hypothetical protein
MQVELRLASSCNLNYEGLFVSLVVLLAGAAVARALQHRWTRRLEDGRPAEGSDGQPAAPSRPAESPGPAATTNTSGGVWTWERRVDRARLAGNRARGKLDNTTQRVEPSVSYPGQNRVFVILRGSSGKFLAAGRPQVVNSWRVTAELLGEERGRNRVPDGAVYHGFASKREAAAYLRGAGFVREEAIWH